MYIQTCLSFGANTFFIFSVGQVDDFVLWIILEDLWIARAWAIFTAQDFVAV
jgi:hypothetical protein